MTSRVIKFTFGPSQKIPSYHNIILLDTIDTQTQTYTCVPLTLKLTYTHAYLQWHAGTHEHPHTLTQHTCRYVCTRTSMLARVRIHTETHTHTYANTHTDTHSQHGRSYQHSDINRTRSGYMYNDMRMCVGGNLLIQAVMMW